MPSDALKYLLQRPPFSLDDHTRADLQRLAAEIRAQSEVTRIEYDAIPKWQLLCYLADECGFVLHGTGDPTIEEFVPRQPVDSNPFGAQNAVYAASDGIWPMYYAVLDRVNHSFSLHNGCIRLLDDQDRESDPFYFFSIESSALAQRPFRNGFVYILPKETFIQDPQSELAGFRFRVAHWASLQAVRPLAIVPVSAGDFPFLDQLRGHNEDVLHRRMKDNPDGFPWVDEQCP